MYGKFDAALFDELECIYPDTCTKDGVKHYRVSAANGGYAGVHIMLNGLKPGIPVTVEVIGEHRSYRLFEMVTLPVEVNTGAKMRSEYLKNDVNANVVRRAPYTVYDVYRPMFNIFTPNGISAAVAFLAKVEYVRKFRSRKWIFIVSHAGETQKLEFVVDEYPFRIASTGQQKQRYVNWFNYAAVAANHNVPLWSDEHFAVIKRYFDVLVYSRQNMVPIHPIYKKENGKIMFEIDIPEETEAVLCFAGEETVLGKGKNALEFAISRENGFVKIGTWNSSTWNTGIADFFTKGNYPLKCDLSYVIVDMCIYVYIYCMDMVIRK